MESHGSLASDWGRGAHLTSEEIVSHIPNTNPTLADPVDKTKKETSYGLTKEALCLVLNEDGVSLAPNVMWGSEMFIVKSYSMLKYTVLEPESFPFLKVHGETCLTNRRFRRGQGGGDGSAIAKIVSEYPHIRGINFNLPNAISQAPNLEGMEHVSGDMFKLIPHTDSVMLMSVLHNWDDEYCKKILRNCLEAIPDYGKVIVIEHFVMPELVENTPEMKRAMHVDLAMMVVCPGAKERTTAEFDALAKSVGFVETKIFSLPHGSCVIEFLKGGSPEAIVE